MRTALGLHPQLAHERADELPLFEALVDETRYVGEIGLEGSPDYGRHADVQQKVFDRILAICRDRGGKILTIHSRRAAQPVLRALEKYDCCNLSVLHWFTGTPRELSEAIDAGCWFSVGPAMLKSQSGQRLAALMPRDRVLTETDGPFGKVGNQSLEPTDVGMALNSLAALWNVSTQEVDRIVKANLRVLTERVPSSGEVD